jgi:hypothetical protein
VSLLVAEMKPVRRLRSVDARTGIWASLTLLCGVLGSYALGVRADLPRKLSDATYLAENAALFVLFASSARYAFQLSVPGVERSALTRSLPVLALHTWVILVVIRCCFHWFDMGIGTMPWWRGLRCVSRMVGLAIVPASVAFIMMRKAAPLQRGRTGGLTLLSAGSLAILGTQVICAKDQPGHVLVWHVGPLLLVALLGIGAGRLFLNHAATRG